MVEVTEFCPLNTTLSGVVEGKLSLCLVNTATDPLLLLISLLGGVHQARLYRRFSTSVDILRPSKLFGLQVVFQLLIPLVTLSGLLLRVLPNGYNKGLTGLDILDLTTTVISWSISIMLTFLERRRQLPISARQKHGPVLLIFWTIAFMQVNFRLIVLSQEDWWERFYDIVHQVDFAFYIATYFLTCGVFVLGLLADGLTPIHMYTNFNQEDSAIDGSDQSRSASEGSTWSGFWRKIRKLIPYMWPTNSPMLQFRVMFILLLLVLARVTNVYVPLFYKKVVDSLSSTPGSPSEWPWVSVCIWVGLKLLQGGGMGQGLLNNTRTFLWIKVQQFTTREVQVGLFQHLHSLGLRWHLGRKTGEVIRIMDRGTGSINSLMQYLIFSILPTIVDIIVAIVYFAVEFNIWLGLMILATMALYLGLTVFITEWRTKFRRKMNTADNDQRTRGVDSLLNAETVKYFSMEKYETDMYRDSIVSYQTEEWKSSSSLVLLNVLQSFIMSGGFLGISLYCAWLVTEKQFTVGDFVMLAAYFTQLMAPLNWLGTLYRVIQESFVNMENMFDLMNEEVEIKDSPVAITFGDKKEISSPITFEAVDFSYKDEKKILSDVSFTVPSGTTTAIVGESGTGKSTIAKLIVRMFEVTEGRVVIDDKNIKDYTQSSLRGAIGVVPQDTVLLNDTIQFNIRYGRMDASDEEVEEAAKLADIHDSILSFPDGYQTKVGERGLKLSGGEKQRVAIARTLLKGPQIMLFDEATSSLDSKTENNIQEAIRRASANRTTVVIAHRLSTIVGADEILVLAKSEGDSGGSSVVERGNHQQLLQMGGRYKELWERQQQDSNKKEE